MQLRDALDDYKHYRDDRTRFPGERRSTEGLFSGREGRLVHVTPDGVLRDYGYPLTGQTGIERSRLGLRRGGDVTWFDDCETHAQSYHDDTALVVTEHVLDDGVATQYDLTLGDAHLTHVTLDVEESDDAELVAFVGFAPDGQDTRIGQLHHDDTIEVYHADEHDFVTSSTGIAEFQGQVPTKFDEILGADPVDLPRPISDDRYEEARLSGNLVCFLPFEDGGTTLSTLLTDRAETPRDHALGRLAELATAYTDVEALERAAEGQVDVPVSADVPHAEAMATDLRVLSLLSAETGLRIAGPDFDPYYAYSGGYGYTWFRDDAEISLFCFEAAERFDLDLDTWHARSARAYCETQREDGSWPHRVWPRNGSLAPGWANGRLEAGDDVDYQADQTGSVIAFLASVRDDLDGYLAARVDETLDRALDGLDETLADDDRPVACQNAWEDMTGRFAHTTATFLEAYATLGATDFEGSDHAAAQATRVYDAVDDLWVDEAGIYALREFSEDAEDAEDAEEAETETETASKPKAKAETDGAASAVDPKAVVEAKEPTDYAAGDLDDRCDSATLGLVAAHRAYDRVDDVDEERLDRLVSHVETVVETLRRTTDDVDGLYRYEGDSWRVREQPDEKIWSVSTAWGAHAAASLAALLDDHDDARSAEFAELARDLLSLCLPGGALCMESGYLPEQVFDDGTPDSATPLGWPHALRLATVALMDEYDILHEQPVVADD
jgi:GH15 family glucan-1,4-alpha-glucosidase